MDEQERSAHLDAIALLEARRLQDFDKFNGLLDVLANDTGVGKSIVNLCSVINALADIIDTELFAEYGDDAALPLLESMREEILRDMQ